VRIAVAACALAAAGAIAAADESRIALVKALGLVDAQKISLDSVARSYYGPSGRAPALKGCLERTATDERIATGLAALAQTHIPDDVQVRDALRFLDTPAGRKFAAAVVKRSRGFRMPNRTDFVIAGVVISPTEAAPAEAQVMQDFFATDAGSRVGRILQDTGGFAQLTRTLDQMYAFAAECGIDLKPPAKPATPK